MRDDRATAGKTQAAAMRGIAGARPVPYWLDQPDAPPARPALAGDTSAALAMVPGPAGPRLRLMTA